MRRLPAGLRHRRAAGRRNRAVYFPACWPGAQLLAPGAAGLRRPQAAAAGVRVSRRRRRGERNRQCHALERQGRPRRVPRRRARRHASLSPARSQLSHQPTAMERRFGTRRHRPAQNRRRRLRHRTIGRPAKAAVDRPAANLRHRLLKRRRHDVPPRPPSCRRDWPPWHRWQATAGWPNHISSGPFRRCT